MVIIVVTHVKSIVTCNVVLVLFLCNSLAMITFSCCRYCQITRWLCVVVVVVRHALTRYIVILFV